MSRIYKIMGAIIAIGMAAGHFLTGFSRFQDPEKPVPIQPSRQRTGDARKGYEYLTTGDYVKGGLPYDFFILGLGKDKKNYLGRTGLNGTVSHEYTVIKAANGENLVAPNCMQCHAQVFGDSLVMGMGNTFMDFTVGQQMNARNMQLLANMLKTSAPAKYEAAKHFLQVTGTIGPYLKTQVRGVNAADRLAAVLVAHRDPQTLEWRDSAWLDIPEEVIPSDVPAWWLLRKKNAMFYNGFGRGDFGRFLMASNLLTVKDTSEAREVDSRINDVLAYIYSLRPPKFPGPISQQLATKGEKIFIKNCSKCHGSYGGKEEYPNLLIPASIIKTDSALYSSNYQNPQFVNWFNNSWFAQGEHPARLEPYKGYIAPPLDGIWSTAPYLHNGSVPTLEGVLDSRKRPTFWSRDFSRPEYLYDVPGWKHTVHQAPEGTGIYNTNLKGYGNYGHYFGDKLSDGERKAVIEYLKTL